MEFSYIFSIKSLLPATTVIHIQHDHLRKYSFRPAPASREILEKTIKIVDNKRSSLLVQSVLEFYDTSRPVQCRHENKCVEQKDFI
jgi:hypothetical protein